MSKAPEKSLFSRNWGERERLYFRQRMEDKLRRKISLDKRAVA